MTEDEITTCVKSLTKHHCESPIEARFLEAWYRMLDKADSHFVMPVKGYVDSFHVIPVKQEFLHIHHQQTDFLWCQHPIENYRVDFLLGRVAYEVEFINDEPGREVMVKTPLVVVECDGHDYHERTKQQAARDRSRDRDLMFLGYRVIRFTGSELHRDAAACARQVDDILKSMTMAVARIV